MVKIEGVSKIFNRHSADEIKALNDVSIHIPNHEFVIVLGSNGSGKSTLLNILAGVYAPDAGKIILQGTDVTAQPEHLRSRSISRVFQNPLSGTAAGLTVLENFRMASLRTKNKSFTTGTGRKFRNTVKEKIAALGLGLENKLDVPMGTLSGGQRQSLTLLMSVMDETKLLLMDEPASALDPKTAELVMQIADKIIRENQLTAILVTHQLKDAVRYGDRIIMMSGGQLTKDVSDKEKTELSAEDIFKWF
jgi:putative ABC transport system ATP-binding protein